MRCKRQSWSSGFLQALTFRSHSCRDGPTVTTSCHCCNPQATRIDVASILIDVQCVQKRALQLYSKCYSVASVTKAFTLKGIETIHRSRCGLSPTVPTNTCIPLLVMRVMCPAHCILLCNIFWACPLNSGLVLHLLLYNVSFSIWKVLLAHVLTLRFWFVLSSVSWNKNLNTRRSQDLGLFSPAYIPFEFTEIFFGIWIGSKLDRVITVQEIFFVVPFNLQYLPVHKRTQWHVEECWEVFLCN
jgi:hypothetical protein